MLFLLHFQALREKRLECNLWNASWNLTSGMDWGTVRLQTSWKHVSMTFLVRNDSFIVHIEQLKEHLLPSMQQYWYSSCPKPFFFSNHFGEKCTKVFLFFRQILYIVCERELSYEGKKISLGFLLLTKEPINKGTSWHEVLYVFVYMNVMYVAYDNSIDKCSLLFKLGAYGYGIEKMWPTFFGGGQRSLGSLETK